MNKLLRKLFKPHSLFIALSGLYRFQFYRRWWGGHWELWWVEICCADIWHDVAECSLETGKRPYAFLHGTPVCEDYRFDAVKLSRECVDFNCENCLRRARNGWGCECDCHQEKV